MRRRFFCGASVVAVALSSAFSAHAATAAASGSTSSSTDTPAEVGEVVVTGSFIAGTPKDGPLPVDVVRKTELEQRGSPTMVQFIKTIPSSGAVIGENNRFGNGNGGATINLRNLNSPTTGARTLVLFNGRRVPGSPQGLGSVDINLLPAAAIGRVEVLKDGAAATYGSDAIAGVVNFITRTDLDGLELAGNFQGIRGSHGDYDVSGAWGNKFDRGNVLFTIGYRHRSQLSVKDRSWALLSGVDGYLTNPLGGWASTGNPGVYKVVGATAPTPLVAGNPLAGFTNPNTMSLFSGTLADVGCAANGGAPYSLTGVSTVVGTACNFQYTTFDNLVENEDHYQVYGEVNVELTDTVKFHGEALWARNDTPLQSWALTGPNQYPAPILASGSSAGGGVSPLKASSSTAEQVGGFYIPAANPGLQAFLAQVSGATCSGTALPYGTTAANCAPILAAAQAQLTNAGLYGLVTSTSWRPVGFAGDPINSDNHSHYSYHTDTWRIAGGFSGKLPWANMGWDVSATYQELDNHYNLEDISVNRLQLGLLGFGSRSSDGAANQCTAAKTNNFTEHAGDTSLGCYYFNPFTNAFAQSESNVGPNPYFIGSSAIAGFNAAAQNRADILNWMVAKQFNEISNRLFVIDGVVHGDAPFKLWGAQPVQWAVGAQYRYDRIVQNPDALYNANSTPCVDSPPYGDGAPFCALTQNGPFLFNADLRPYDVKRKIVSGYFEVRMPVLDTLDVTVATRAERYEGVGTTVNPKMSAKWQIVDGFALRASLGTTYRAPAANYLTNTFVRGLSNANGTYRASDLYGNPNLKAETAFTYDVGGVFKFGGLSATVDYWNFNFANPITTESTTDLTAIMFSAAGTTPLANSNGTLTAAGCADPLSGRFTFTGGCVANVTKSADILSYRTQYINGGRVKSSGIDFQVNFDAGNFGSGDLTMGADGTYLIAYDEAPYSVEGHLTAGGVVAQRAGTYRASIFTGYNRLRLNAFLNYQIGIHNFRWQIRYVSGTVQSETLPNLLATNISNATNTTVKADIKSYVQSDLTYRAELPYQTTLTLSIQNIFDQDPPFALGTQYNYDPGSGNPLGRVFSVGVKKKF
ncbi:MAG: TonB-dependent receptor [Proteobacteria bacterium]|nr:TonB-dependent receptor [Pseudomonadota bacterium]